MVKMAPYGDQPMAKITIDWAGEEYDLSSIENVVDAFSSASNFRPDQFKVLQLQGPGGGWPEIEIVAPYFELMEYYVYQYSGGNIFAAEDFENLVRAA